MNYISRIIIAAILLFSIIFKIHEGFLFFEMHLVETGFVSWVMAPFLVRCILLVEVVLAGYFIFGQYNRKMSWWTLGTLLVIYGLDLLAGVGNLHTVDYSLLYYKNYWISLVVLGILAINLALIDKRYKQKIAIKWYWFVLAILPFCILSYLLRPISFKDYELNDSVYSSFISNWPVLFDDLYVKYPEFKNEDEYIVAFFRTGCGHCIDYAQRLGVTQRGYASGQKVIMVFWDSKNEIEVFMERTHFDGPYLILTKDEVTNLAGTGFPKFFQVKDKKVVKEYSSSQMNYAELSALFGE